MLGFIVENIDEGFGVSMSKKRKIMIAITVAAVLLASVPVYLFVDRGGGDDRPPGQLLREMQPLSPISLDYSVSLATPDLLGISITPLAATATGVAVDSAFLIESEENQLTEAHIMASLSLRSGEAFTLEPTAGNAFTLRMDAPLENNRVYNFIYQPPGRTAASHAFQTEDIFRIASTSPADATHNIPVDAGVEVTFTRPLDGDFSQHFSIYPRVDGRFLQRDNIHIFAPNVNLEFGTVYTVTVSGGLASACGSVIDDDVIFQFVTGWGQGRQREFWVDGGTYRNFLPWNEIFIPIGLDWNFTQREYNVRIYNIPTHYDFINFANPGSLVEDMTLELTTIDGDFSQFHYLFLGQTLPEGLYIARIRSTNETVAATADLFIQVSPLAVYSLAIGGDLLLWVNDAATGEPAAGATITADGQNATTNSDGIAIIQTAENPSATVIIQYGQHQFVYAKQTFGRDNLLPRDKFLSYMYTDRPRYRPDDLVDVFGVIMPLPGHNHDPADVFTLQIGNMQEIPIILDRFNSFAKRVPVSGMFGHADITVLVNGERLMSAWVEFVDYTNLDLVLEGQLDRLAYFIGDTVDVKLTATNFVGMPVEDIRFTGGVSGIMSNLRTGEDGIAQAEMVLSPINFGWSEGWEPIWHSAWFNTAGDVHQSQNIDIPLIVAPRDIMMEHEFDGETATLTASEVVLGRLNSGELNLRRWDFINLDYIRGNPVDIDFTMQITRHTTVRTLRHQRYDHINRRNINIYDFNTISSAYRRIEGRTEGGMATITGLPTSDDPLIRYTIEVFYADNAGRPTTVWLMDNRWWHFQNESEIRSFSMMMEDSSLGIGQSTTVSLVEGDVFWGPWMMQQDMPETETPEGRFLVVTAREGVISAAVGDPAGVDVTFTEDAISNAFVFGAFFDGEFIFQASRMLSLHFDYSDRELGILLEFDQESYRPGDEVTLTISTTRPGAQLLVSVVDESAIVPSWWGNHDADFLHRFYMSAQRFIWGGRFGGGSFVEFVSHMQFVVGGALYGLAMAESRDALVGGNAAWRSGDANVMFDSAEAPAVAMAAGMFEAMGFDFREDFTDNPVFELVQTGTGSTATLTFTLPDQITAWRVVAIGITEDGFAGDTSREIPSYLDFFVDLLLTPEYILGDEIAALATATGTGGDDVTFAFRVMDANDTVLYEWATTAAGRAEFNAGQLGLGEYTMQVLATFGDLYDAMLLPFTVVENALIIPARAEFEIADGADLSGLSALALRDMPVHVTFTNANIGPIMRILHGAWSWRPFRTDNIAAEAFAGYFFGGELDVDSVRSRVHSQDGGIAQLVYEQSDFFYTARFAASFPEFVNRDRIIAYVNTTLEFDNMAMAGASVRSAWPPLPPPTQVSPARYAAGLLALAAMGEPVLIRAQNFAKTIPAEDYIARLYMAMALVVLGDDVGAAVATIGIPQQFGDETPPTDREYKNTLWLFINTTINPQAAWSHLNSGRRNRLVSDVPERINFVRSVMMTGGTISEISYSLNGQTNNITLENFDRHNLHITRGQFEALDITHISGETTMHVNFYAQDASNWDETHRRIELRREIVPLGDRYRVDFQINLPPDARGFFTIHDRLPSNMRFLPSRRNWNSSSRHHASHVQGQLVDIGFWVDPEGPFSLRVGYYAMSLFEAEMMLSAAYVTNWSIDGHIWGRTE